MVENGGVSCLQAKEFRATSHWRVLLELAEARDKS